MNDSVDWSGGNDFIKNILNAKNMIETSTTRMVPNKIIMSDKVYRQIKVLFSDDDIPMKVEIEDYDR